MSAHKLKFVATLLTGLVSGVAIGHDASGQEHISDNSFLIEEAYNQEPGVIQHIYTWEPSWNRTNGELEEFAFTYVVEMPLGSECHQLSFTPLVFEHFSDFPDGGPHEEEGGYGDVSIDYRYQLAFEDPCGLRPAISPRFSVILPTGDDDRGLGTGEVGYEFNLPVSKQFDEFAVHFNAGATVTPEASDGVATHDLDSYNIGASAIWLMNYDFNMLVEVVTLLEEELDGAGNVVDSTTVLLNPGFRWAMFTGEEVQWVGGAAIPIGLTDDSPDYGVFIYMSVEHIFRQVD